MDSVAGEERSAWQVADLWIPAATLPPFLTDMTDMSDCDKGDTVPTCVADACIPAADSESIETLLPFLK